MHTLGQTQKLRVLHTRTPDNGRWLKQEPPSLPCTSPVTICTIYMSSSMGALLSCSMKGDENDSVTSEWL